MTDVEIIVVNEILTPDKDEDRKWWAFSGRTKDGIHQSATLTWSILFWYSAEQRDLLKTTEVNPIPGDRQHMVHYTLQDAFTGVLLRCNTHTANSEYTHTRAVCKPTNKHSDDWRSGSSSSWLGCKQPITPCRSKVKFIPDAWPHPPRVDLYRPGLCVCVRAEWGKVLKREAVGWTIKWEWNIVAGCCKT